MVAATSGGPTATTPLLWAGQYYDSTTSLYYMRARWYDPATGEFLSVDRDFSQTLDAYGYADENPVDGIDPSGLSRSQRSYYSKMYDSYIPTGCRGTGAHNGCAVVAAAMLLNVDYSTIEKATTKEVQAAVQAAENGAVALGDALASVQQDAASLAQAQSALKKCQDSKSCTDSYQGPGEPRETVYANMVSLHEKDLKGALMHVYGASSDLASGIGGALKPPSSFDDILKWGGLILGTVSVITGGVAGVAGALGYATAAETIGGVSAVTGLGASTADAVECAKGSDAACLSAGFGLVATGAGAFAASGAARVAAASTASYAYTAFPIAAQAVGFFGESAGMGSLVIDAEMAALEKG